MRTLICLLFVLSLVACTEKKGQKNTPLSITSSESVICPKNTAYRVIHTFVALCDNEHQGIVKVPTKIGNGKDPENNLYWGCDLGTKTFIKKHKDWKLIQTLTNPRENVLERCVFKHKTSKTVLVADAYDGEFIKKCTVDFLKSCAGDFNDFVVVDNDSIATGGDADLLTYIGHNGLMDFRLGKTYLPQKTHKREVIILGCISKRYFTPFIKPTGATPLLWTTGLMAPEAYILTAATEGWLKNEPAEAIKERAAQAYNQYQKCGIKGARNLFDTNFE